MFKKLFNWLFVGLWYHPGHDQWFPKCAGCKGSRDKYCPTDCMGDK